MNAKPDTVCHDRFNVWIGQFKMDGFAWKFSELTGKEKGMFLEYMPKRTMLHVVEVSQDHVINLDLMIIGG